MRSTLSLCLALFCLAAVPAFAGDASVDAVSPLDVVLEEIVQPAVDGEICDDPAADAQPASTCRFGGPVCTEDDQCDDYCGDPAFGNCEIQGHFPTGCCVCLG